MKMGKIWWSRIAKLTIKNLTETETIRFIFFVIDLSALTENEQDFESL